jgi:hypothetical protein
MSEHAAGQRHEILSVSEHNGHRYLLWLSYEDGDSPNAQGNIVRQEVRRGAGVQTICRTNDTLRALWVAPSGHLWAGSTNGTIGTTAPVSWSPPRKAWIRFVPENQGPTWQVTSLPLIREQGIPPSITTLWGTGDQHVWAGAYDGHIYAWDGQSWTQVVDGPKGGGGAINAFGGSGPDDVYAVGANGRILHFDGRAWTLLQPPGAPQESEGFTGVQVLPNGQVLITGAGPGPVGRVLQGGPAGLVEITRCEVAPRDIVALGDRLLLPAGGAGVAELKGRTVEVLKNNFNAVACSASSGRAYFIEAVQQQPSFIEFDPSEAAPWVRVTL